MIAEDELTAPLRAKVDAWADGHPTGSLRERLNYLVSCSRCVSVYAAAAILAAQAVPQGRPLVKVLALSQAGLAVLTYLDMIERRQA